MSFVHLRLHSSCSLSKGVIHIKDIAKLCKENNMPAVALTDINNMFGAVEFSDKTSKCGIQPIMGCSLSMIEDNISYSNILLAKDEVGYKQLLSIISDFYMKYNNKIRIDDIKDNLSNLICLSGSKNGLLHKGDIAKQWLDKTKIFFGDRLYIELSRPYLSVKEQNDIINIANDINLPIVATNEVFYPYSNYYDAHEVLTCIANKTFLSVENREKSNPNFYFKTIKDMCDLFCDIPSAIENTVNIAKRCSFYPTSIKVSFPKAETFENRNEEAELEYKTKTGLEDRINKINYLIDKNVYEKRLNTELAMINKMGFAGYFLIVSDFVNWAKENNIPVGPGRGSGAGSIVAWSLRITNIDPIRFGLIFERFLNPDRVSMPDFDIDFCQDRRAEVINYVFNKYGFDKVAHIITFGKLQARAVVKDVGRVLGMPYGQVNKISKTLPFNPNHPITLSQAIEMDDVIKKMIEEDPQIDNLMQISLKLEGLYRHASVHAAGIVIGREKLVKNIPLYKDIDLDAPVTQFDMKWIEYAGAIKFDFLGLRTLTVIQQTVKLLEERNIIIDTDNLPLDDRLTFEKIQTMQTVGVFQLESRGMQEIIKNMLPDSLEDLIALVSLFRPGPIDDIPNYINGKHNYVSVTYLDPMLEDILKPTYGVMVYQEQVMKIAQVMGGYTMGEADILRRAMGKKNKQEMDMQKDRFISGAKKNGVEESVAITIFGQMEKFSGYGFNKSHAAPYALLSYITGYLKAHYPLEFMSSTMKYDISSIELMGMYILELRKMGFDFLPPCINKSDVYFSVDYEKNAIICGLSNTKGIGVNLSEEIIKARGNGFSSVADLINKVPSIKTNQLQALASSGALDILHNCRREIYENSDIILMKNNRNTSQMSIFGNEAFSIPKVAEWSNKEKANMEFITLGFYLSVHPLSGYMQHIENKKLSNIKELNEDFYGMSGVAKVACVINKVQQKISKKGNKYAFITISDLSGVMEIRVFSTQLAESVEQLVVGNIVLLDINVTTNEENNEQSFILQKCNLLDDEISSAIKKIHIIINNENEAEKISDFIKQNGNIQVIIFITTIGRKIALSGKYKVDFDKLDSSLIQYSTE